MDFWKYLHPLLKTDNDSRYSTANYAVLKSLADSLSDAERDTLSKKIQLIFETATGDYLDEYGKWFGVSRYPNEDDNDYRERIKHYLLIPRSTVQGIVEGIQYYLNDTKAQISIYEPWKNIFYLNKSNLNGDDHLPGYYYRYAIIDVHIDRPMSQAIHDAIEAFKPAGVKFYVTVDGNLGEDVKRLILADFKVTRLDTINRMFGFNYARILPFTFADRLDTLVPNTDYFKTNDSKLNESDVLAGSPMHNVTYWNPLKTSDSPYKDVPVNLLTGTSDYSAWSKGTTVSIDSSIYPNVAHYPLTATTTNDDFFKKIGVTFFEPSTSYTLSFKAKGSGLLNVYVFPNVSTSGTGDNFHQYQLTSDYKICSFSFVTSSNISGSKTVLFRNGVTTLEAYITQVKLEKGTSASPWSPNPADPEYYMATDEQRAVLSTNNSTYLTLPATKYKDVPVNLLTNSSTAQGWNNYSNWTVADDKYNGLTVFKRSDLWLGLYQLVKIASSPTAYTWSAWAKEDDYDVQHPSGIAAFWKAMDKNGNVLASGRQNIDSQINSVWNRVFFTLPASSIPTDTDNVNMRIEKVTDDGKYLYIAGIKIESGDTASPWSPNPADPEYYENMIDGTLSLYNQLVNNYSSIVNLYSGNTNYEKVVSMLKDSNIAIQEKVVSDKAVLINGIVPNKDGIIDIDKSKISYTGSDITVPLVVTSTDTCRISYAGAGIYIRLALPGMGTNLKSDQLETKIKKA